MTVVTPAAFNLVMISVAHLLGFEGVRNRFDRACASCFEAADQLFTEQVRLGTTVEIDMGEDSRCFA
jgi:hypothetical protein